MLKKVIAGMLAAVLLTSAFTTFLYAKDAEEAVQKKIRVGFSPTYGFMEITEGGQYSGIVCDYLREISKYTGWEYEYVEGGPDETLKNLEDGTIDLLGSMIKSKDTIEHYQFAEYSSGYGYSTLLARSDDPSATSDNIQSLEGKTIGVFKRAITKIEKLKSFLQANRLNCEIVEFDTPEAYLACLENRETDLMLSGDPSQIENTRRVINFASEPYYFASKKGNVELIRRLDSALEKINVTNPDFGTELREKYFEGRRKEDLVFSEEEQNYIKSRGTLRVVAAPNWRPYQYITNQGTLSGISAGVLDFISEKTGLEFTFIPTESLGQSLKLLQSGQADLLAGIIDDDRFNTENGLISTRSYYEMPQLVLQNNRSLADGRRTRRAVANDFSFMTRDGGPDDVIIPSASLGEALELVHKGEADYTVLSQQSAMFLLMRVGYKNITAIPSNGPSENMSIGLPKPADTVLLSILNKAIGTISDEQYQSFSVQNAVDSDEKITLSRFVYANPLMATFVVIVFFLLVILALIAFYSFRIKNERRLTQLATRDLLTGARNFESFKAEARRLFEKWKRCCIIYFDVKNFKFINNCYGYECGDRILCEITRIAEQFLGEEELLARVSGNTFVLISRDTDKNVVKNRYERLIRDIERIRVEEDSSYRIQISAGVFCTEAENADSINDMIDRANMAQKYARNSSGEELDFAFFESFMRENLLNEQAMEGRAPAALENGEFCVYYQPKYSTQTMRPCSAEALVRWNAGGTLISPAQFIWLFERNHFILKLDRYVFEQCCKKLRERLDAGRPVVSISVNVSRVQLFHRQFVEDYVRIKEAYDIPEGLLELEFTESILFEDVDRLAEIIAELKLHGFLCSIDDFGRGYSSLTILKSIPVDILKLDAQFFEGDYEKGRNGLIIQHVISMAESLEMQTVAEGIEQLEQVDYLRNAGCDIIQGYVFAKPMPEELFYQFLDEITERLTGDL